MSSMYGKNIKVSVFGQSHSEGIGVVVDGIPAGKSIDMDKLAAFMSRRAPGRTDLSTARREEDSIEILGGIIDGHTCGAPLAAVIRNNDVRSKDYSELKVGPRPGHADYTAEMKYSGFQDIRGGGHFSARLTAPLCIAGGVILQILEDEGIHIGAHIKKIKDVEDTLFDTVKDEIPLMEEIKGKSIPVIDDTAGERMRSVIEKAREDGDSVGGIVEVKVTGLEAGIGDPMFEGMENRIASAVFGIPAVKGIEFGNGFSSTDLYGSQNNDAFFYEDGNVRTRTNNHGGILGGITTGMPLVYRVAFKPTPSIFKEQDTVDMVSGENAKLVIKGRHDPCIVIRAVPVVEAVTAIAIYDAYLERKKEI